MAQSGVTVDCNLLAIAIMAVFWYCAVPDFWEAATKGAEVHDSVWLSCWPLIVIAFAGVIFGVLFYYFGRSERRLFQADVRIFLLLGSTFLVVLMLDRVSSIQRFRKAQTDYLARSEEYAKQWNQGRQRLESELEVHSRALNTVLERIGTGPVPDLSAQISMLGDEVKQSLEATPSESLAGIREKAAKIESGRAHDFRADGRSLEEYCQSLASQEPGAELLESAQATPGGSGPIDPLIRLEAVALGAQVTESALRVGGLL